MASKWIHINFMTILSLFFLKNESIKGSEWKEIYDLLIQSGSQDVFAIGGELHKRHRWVVIICWIFANEFIIYNGRLCFKISFF